MSFLLDKSLLNWILRDNFNKVDISQLLKLEETWTT